MKKHITKAIFPVAGLGTRFLPATKANPKEMLPIVDKPLIQYAVEEAIEAGITDLIFVTNSSKRAIEDHFDSNFELESALAEKGKNELLEIVNNILPKGINCAYVRQRHPLGLGHAVLCAEPLIDNEYFAVLLADDLINNKRGCLAQMVDEFSKNEGSIVSVQTIPESETHKYGVVEPDSKQGGLTAIKGIVEKPKAADAPSNLGVVGRYILSSNIFSILSETVKDSGGEIQLTDAIADLIKRESVYAYEFEGTRFDCGSKLGYLQATMAYGLQHAEIGKEFKEYLASL